MFTKILIPASIAAFGLIAVPVAQAHVTHHHHHTAATSLFASPHHTTTAHAHAHGVHSLKTHTHRSLKGQHVHASLHHVSKVSHTTKPLSEGGTAQPNV